MIYIWLVFVLAGDGIETDRIFVDSSTHTHISAISISNPPHVDEADSKKVV